MNKIITLDLNFLGIPGTIASYLIPHSDGVILIESGPGSTISALINGLKNNGFRITDITHVFLTHIHLDHAGAAGWLASNGAHILVHGIGAPHLINPGKLLSSARRIYGDRMEMLWGDFLPIPQRKLTIIQGGQVVNIGGIEIRAIDTPGHANHHLSYIFNNTLFSGDIGGVRLNGLNYVGFPMPPPEFHLETWKDSLECLRRESVDHIALTHFGIYDDYQNHLRSLNDQLTKNETWLEKMMAANPSEERFQTLYIEFVKQQYLEYGISDIRAKVYETVNPSYMSAAGIMRYWKKYRENHG